MSAFAGSSLAMHGGYLFTPARMIPRALGSLLALLRLPDREQLFVLLVGLRFPSGFVSSIAIGVIHGASPDISARP
jgi:hypothetical protein